MSIFEVIMLLCFGAAWPVSIAKSLKTRRTDGKSLVFLLIVIAGYAAGIVNKLLYKPDFVVWLYALNATMVSIDAGLWLRNRRIEKDAGKGSSV
ncbi:MAG: hypothetical protein CVV51_13050 [Spirochaetae bacterium HGW-Spirochaetae-7]|jgi:hypothetical protein|nr:MAG: hypothetical protein CVV51_13050 [Spirochaetae bacterium HGW-Spirochaetae-7]